MGFYRTRCRVELPIKKHRLKREPGARRTGRPLGVCISISHANSHRESDTGKHVAKLVHDVTPYARIVTRKFAIQFAILATPPTPPFPFPPLPSAGNYRRPIVPLIIRSIKHRREVQKRWCNRTQWTLNSSESRGWGRGWFEKLPRCDDISRLLLQYSIVCIHGWVFG